MVKTHKIRLYTKTSKCYYIIFNDYYKLLWLIKICKMINFVFKKTFSLVLRLTNFIVLFYVFSLKSKTIEIE